MTSKSYNYSVQLVFDSNILADALLDKGPYYKDAIQLLDMVRDDMIEGWYSPHSLTTIYYRVEKFLLSETDNRSKTVESAQKLVKKLVRFLKPLPQVGDELLHLDIQEKDDLEALIIVFLAVDILPDTYNMDPDQVEGTITSKTRAVMSVSIYGQCAHMTRINDVAKKTRDSGR